MRRCCLCRAPPPQPPPRPPSTHEQNQIDRAVRPLESYQIGICASIRRTEKVRSYVVDSMQTGGVEQRRQDFGERRGGNREAMPKTIPPWLAHMSTNTWNAAMIARTGTMRLTLTHTSLRYLSGIIKSPDCGLSVKSRGP